MLALHVLIAPNLVKLILLVISFYYFAGILDGKNVIIKANDRLLTIFNVLWSGWYPGGLWVQVQLGVDF